MKPDPRRGRRANFVGHRAQKKGARGDGAGATSVRPGPSGQRGTRPAGAPVHGRRARAGSGDDGRKGGRKADGSAPGSHPGRSVGAGGGAQVIRAQDDADELYRLAGRIVCVEQEVANKVEMCVASKRNEGDRRARAAQGGGADGGEARIAPPGHDAGAPSDVPDNSARISEKVKYLKYYWREMRAGWQHGVSEDQFAGHVIEADASRAIVAHSSIVHNDGTLTNVQRGTNCGVEDLEGFLRGVYRALDSINMLCEYMGLDDYAGYVRQRQGGAGRRGAAGDGAAGGAAARGAHAAGRARAK